MMMDTLVVYTLEILQLACQSKKFKVTLLVAEFPLFCLICLSALLLLEQIHIRDGF